LTLTTTTTTPPLAEPADARNPGPAWGHAFIGFCLEHMPGWFNRGGLKFGAWLCMKLMPPQRRASREYLRAVLGREPTTHEVWQHFHAFAQYLFLRLEIAHGRTPRLRSAPGEDHKELFTFAASGQPALYGTLHVGHSDLLGYFLGHLGAKLHMVRKRVRNSEDTERLAQRYGGSITYLWINSWNERVFATNDALRAGRSVAMQCDRIEYSAKRETFRFLGAQRQMPFTIYHLAIMHGLPVVFAYAVADAHDPGASLISALPIFRPRTDATRQENFAAARAHFQTVLDRIEDQLQRTPFQWFNFVPLNPVATTTSAVHPPELEHSSLKPAG
jgi:predicted LPLAT superfamily acyltransferase